MTWIVIRHALKDMPLLLLFPAIPMVIALLAAGYWVVGAALILTAEEITFDQLAETIRFVVALAAAYCQQLPVAAEGAAGRSWLRA